MERLRAIFFFGDWRLSTVSWCAAKVALRLALTAAAFVQQVRCGSPAEGLCAA